MKLVLKAVVAASSLAVPFGWAIWHAERRGLYDFGSRFHPAWLVVYGAMFMLSAFIFGVPTIVEKYRQAFLAALLAAALPLAIASIFFVIYDPRIPRLIVVATPLVLAVVFFVASASNVLITNLSHERDVVIAVLDPADFATFHSDIERPAERKFQVVDTLDATEVALEGEASLRERITRAGASLVVLSETAQMHDAIVVQAAHLHESGVRIRSLAAFYDEWLGKLPLTELERTGMWFDIRDLHEQFYPRIKRLMDVAVSLATLPALGLVIPALLVANRVGNRGPLFFAQDRVGHQGRTFRILKFRTMLQNEQVAGRGEWTAENDPRITPVGKLMRKAHIDELPQIVNVLRGDLSIVGPRPEQVHYVEELTEKVPFYGLRHAVRPGMTGWAQVKYPYGSSVQDAIEKLQYDLYYLRHQSPTLDARVCVRTFTGVLFGRGR